MKFDTAIITSQCKNEKFTDVSLIYTLWSQVPLIYLITLAGKY